MKSVRMVEAGRPLELQEIPIPAIGDRDILEEEFETDGIASVSRRR